jgi:hypothetical protein
LWSKEDTNRYIFSLFTEPPAGSYTAVIAILEQKCSALAQHMEEIFDVPYKINPITEDCWRDHCVLMLDNAPCNLVQAKKVFDTALLKNISVWVNRTSLFF